MLRENVGAKLKRSADRRVSEDAHHQVFGGGWRQGSYRDACDAGERAPVVSEWGREVVITPCNLHSSERAFHSVGQLFNFLIGALGKGEHGGFKG